MSAPSVCAPSVCFGCEVFESREAAILWAEESRLCGPITVLIREPGGAVYVTTLDLVPLVIECYRTE